MIIKVKAELKDVPVTLLPECPVSVKTYLKNHCLDYMTIDLFREHLLNGVAYATKPQAKGIIRLLAQFLHKPLNTEVIRLRINEKDPKEKLMGLKYKLQKL